MTEMHYDPIHLACIILQKDLGARAGLELINWVFAEEQEFLHPDYRRDKKALMSKTLYWVDYLTDKVKIDQEFPAIARDFISTGLPMAEEQYVSEYPELDLFFMSMRLRLRYLDPQGYARMKLRTLLKGYGYKRRSRELIQRLRESMDFYRIRSYLRGEVECDIWEIDVDDMITFRVDGGQKEN